MVETTELVPGAHRTVRRLDERESPFGGVLVGDGGRQRVCADAAGLDATLWDFAGAEHVAGVQDVMAEGSGQAVLLPWCLEPVEVFLTRRSAAGRPLSPGEIVTLTGSLLRGVVEVGGHGLTGRWWLDDRSCPLFVPGDGTACTTAADAVVERVRADCHDRALERLLGRIHAGLSDHRVVARSVDEWERELTDLAAPRALESEVRSPERVRDIPVHRAVLDGDREAFEDGPGLRERLLVRGAALVQRCRSILPERAPRPARDRRRATRTAPERSARPPRRRMLVVGLAVAGMVLVGGMLWPVAEGTERAPHAAAVAVDSSASPAPTAEAGSAERTGSGRAEPDLPETEGDDLATAASRLLALIDACRVQQDSACPAAVVDGAGSAVLERLGAHAADRTTTLIEDYGDVAVIRVAARSAHAEQMMVMVQGKDGWLVRDVYDVADQPSDGN